MRVRLSVRLFLALSGLLAFAILVVYLLLSSRLERDLLARERAAMSEELTLVSFMATRLTDGSRAGWDELADALGAQGSTRLSFISADGELLGDSEVDLDSLETQVNHGGRPEVQGALAGERAFDDRMSQTVGERMLYVAQPIARPGGETVIVRLSIPLRELDDLRAHLRRQMVLAALGALFVSLLVSALTSGWITRSMTELTRTANRMAGGDLVVRSPQSGQSEFSELGRALDHLAESLSRALHELEHERNLLKGVLTGMREGILVVKSDGTVALANKAVMDALPLPKDVVGKKTSEGDLPWKLRQVIEEAKKSGAPLVRELELGSLNPFRARVSASPIEWEGRGTLLVFADVTELRRLESLRRDFVANVSHELRTPISNIRSSTETLSAIQAEDPVATEFLEIVSRNAERLQRQVEDLLELSKIESGSMRFQAEPIDPKAAIAAMIEVHGVRAADRKIEFDVKVEEGAAEVLTDRRALDQILSNLIENEAKYANYATRVDVRVRREGPDFILSISDRGPGVGKEHLPRLFERFYRVDPGRARAQGGTGLGLSIVKHLCEAMGGSATAASVLGEGTTFTVRLPHGVSAAKSSPKDAPRDQV